MIKPESIVDHLIFNTVRIEVEYEDGTTGTYTVPISTVLYPISTKYKAPEEVMPEEVVW